MGFSIGGLISGVTKFVTGASGLASAVSAFGGSGGGSVGPAAAPLAPSHAHAEFGPRFGLTQHGQFATGAAHQEAHLMSQFRTGGLLVPGLDFPKVQQFGATSIIARTIGVGGLLATLFATSRSRTGQPINRKKVVAAVKHCGIELASDLFSLSAIEICQIVISRPRRRGRGISAADLRRTRATIRKVHNISADLKRLSPARRHHK